MKKGYLFLLLAIMLGTTASSRAFAGPCEQTGGTVDQVTKECTSCPTGMHSDSKQCVKG